MAATSPITDVAPLSLTQAAKLERDVLKAGVIELFASSSPILELLPQMDITGNAFRYNVDATLPTVAWRAVNASYTDNAGTYTNADEALYIVGGEIDVDRFIVKTRGSVNDQRAIASNKKVKALSIEYTRVFIDGDNTTNPLEPDGLNIRITGSQVITAATNGAVLTMDMLDALIAQVVGAPNVLLTFKAMQREITKLLRASQHFIETGADSFGRQVKMYDGIPIRILDELEYATPILGFDETTGTASANTGSIYALHFGADEFLTGLQNGGMMVDDLGLLESQPVYRTRVEWYVGFANMHPRSAARLKGVKAS